ncbi:hypothetical protein Undi14_04715 [Undibacterium sp. 14-3-2]|uniref:hypothetical protein n=1 Tax=Undibacterium sp. 14-3-2 TaxID=2800129 RepID=UPI001904D08B|nr:hypothetical protein [Undibacterium sp. 14-3-2]MBK1889325.1 hypothetical protein [Undibacterium sp. 14-3-2]
MTTPNIPNETTFFTLQEPSWEYWSQQKQARLWEAVALACNLDPFQFTNFGLPNLDKVFARTPAQFNDLLNQAKVNLGNPLLKPIAYSKDGSEESEIELAKFGAWLKSMRYPLPELFPWQDQALSPLSREWPWGEHETKLLRHLAAAANRFWKNYDAADPTTAPTNKEVVDWLVENGVANRTASVMATILRADGLSTGPRK